MIRKLALAWSVATAACLLPADLPAQDPPIHVGGLAEGRYGRMDAKIEKTFLGVDAYEVRIRFGEETAREIERLARGKKLTDRLETQIANLAYRTDHAYARIVFLRDVSYEQFIKGVKENLANAREAGMISPTTHAKMIRGIPRWFSFLKDRGIRDGEQLLYRARPDALRTVYLDRKGRELLDQTDRGVDHPRAALAGYFAPGNDSRRPLIESLFED